MGNAGKIRRKYKKPGHPWQKERLEVESKLRKEYGTGNKAEIWKMNGKFKTLLNTAKRVASPKNAQEKIEHSQLIDRLKHLGLVKEGEGAEGVLSLKLNNYMDRRLQTIVFKKGLAFTVKQARQMIVHRHITVGNKVITSPSYIVPADKESLVEFVGLSSFSNKDHPERTKKTKAEFEKVEKEKAKSKEKESKDKEVEEKVDLTKEAEQ